MKPRIRVFTNRIEFFNPGALPKPYEELQKRDISLPRNPLVTKMFRIIDLAENAGYGFDKMIKGWKTHYSKSPVISGDIDNYRIEFFFSEGVNEGVSELLEIIRQNPGKRVPDFVKLLGRPSKTIERWVKVLRDDGKIEFKGSPKLGGYWVILR